MLTRLPRLLSGSLFDHVTNSAAPIRRGPLGTALSIRHRTSPLNKKVEEDDQLVKVDTDDSEYEVEEYEPEKIEPVKQRLINRIPVEYHGIRAEHFSDETNWLPVYRVPYINALRRVIRAKVYVTCISVGTSIYYTSQILIGNWTGEIWQAGVLSIISLAGMAYIGDYFRRLVVQIYASEDSESVRFCRFTFFGRRRDMVLPVDCIVRLPEINRSLRQPMMDIKFRLPEGEEIEHDYDNYEFYELGFRLPIGLGGVLDRDRFQKVLGYMLSYRVGG